MKKLVAFILAAAMLFSFAACGGQDKIEKEDETKKSPETVAVETFEKYLHAVEKVDTETVVKLLPARLVSDDEYADALATVLEESINEENYGLSKKFGDGYTYDITDVNADELDAEDLEKYEDYYSDFIDSHDDFEAPRIDGGYKIKCKLIIKGESREKDGKCTAYVIKENNKWIIWSIDTSVPGADVISDLG